MIYTIGFLIMSFFMIGCAGDPVLLSNITVSKIPNEDYLHTLKLTFSREVLMDKGDNNLIIFTKTEKEGTEDEEIVTIGKMELSDLSRLSPTNSNV